jgi:molybdopterin-dependent oxidoreductase alpha subunit
MPVVQISAIGVEPYAEPMAWNRASWVSLRPNGIGLQKPNHYGDMAKVAWENRKHPKLAWDILSKGVCDGCALGVAGFHDWTIDGVHLCTTRLRLLALNTADAIPAPALADVDNLRTMSNAELRQLGRLSHPMRRRRGERGFTRISWDEALDAAAARMGGDRTAIFLTSRGVTNETYYVCGKAARAMGVASVDSAARVCHAPSTVALKETIGAAATTCSFVDVLESDLVVLIGANPATNQPVFMKYLYEAKRNGTKVVVVNPYLEPGLERYWVPSSPESALFGTKISDLHVPVTPGGDTAFCNAVVKELIRRDAVDHDFIATRTTGWDELMTWLDSQSIDDLLAHAGVDRATLDAFVDLYAGAGTAVLVWSMGITQRRESVAGVKAIVNLGLARGNIGRDGAGLMPIRGHSGVQGGAEMGAYSTALPGGISVTPESAAALAAQWGFDVPGHVGLTAPEMVEAAERDDLDVLYLAGGSFLDVLPDPDRVRLALERVPVRVHQDVVLTTQMLLDPPDGGEVIVLPAATRYEQEGGGTETTTERRIVFSPPIAEGRMGEARSEWRIFAGVARRVRPDLAPAFDWRDGDELRREIARVVPLYAGIETLRNTGDAVQYGGRHLPIATAAFSVVDVEPPALAANEFEVTTRRGKQFNSMLYGNVDPLNGASRDEILVSHRDAKRLGLSDGDIVVLRSDTGSLRGRVRREKLPAGSIQVHWPEGNVLISSGPSHREPRSNVPDYTAIVTIERVP